MLRILSVVGGRPHPIKVAPIHRALESSLLARHLIADLGYMEKGYALETYSQLRLPDPILRFEEPEGSRKDVLGVLIGQARRALEEIRPDHVLIYGDLDTSVAAGVAVRSAGIEFTHVEAGLRSGDVGYARRCARGGRR